MPITKSNVNGQEVIVYISGGDLQEKAWGKGAREAALATRRAHLHAGAHLSSTEEEQMIPGRVPSDYRVRDRRFLGPTSRWLAPTNRSMSDESTGKLVDFAKDRKLDTAGSLRAGSRGPKEDAEEAQRLAQPDVAAANQQENERLAEQDRQKREQERQAREAAQEFATHVRGK